MPVHDLAVSPDGSRLAAADFGGGLRIWDVARGKALVGGTAHTEIASGVAFRPDGLAVATVGGDGALRLWNVGSGALLAEARAHTRPATDLAFTPDGSQIVTGGLDGLIAVWTYDHGTSGLKQLRSGGNAQLEVGQGGFDLTVHPSVGVATVDFSPDGTLLAIGGDSGTVLIRRYPSLDLVRTLRGHTQSLTRAGFSPDGTRLVTASLDGSARVWDVSTGKALHVFRGPYPRGVLAAAFSPDGRVVAVGSRDHHVDVWDAVTGAKLGSLPDQPGGMWAVVFAPRARWLATGGYDVRFNCGTWARCGRRLALCCCLLGAAAPQEIAERDATRLGKAGLDLLDAGRSTADRATLLAAREKFREALAIWLKLGHIRGQAVIIGKMAETDRALGNLPSAIKLHLTAAHLARKLRADEFALKQYELALQVTIESGDELGLCGSLGGRGDVSLALGNLSRARQDLNEATAICRRHRDPDAEANAWAALGELHTRQGRYHDALTALGAASTIKATDPAINMRVRDHTWASSPHGKVGSKTRKLRSSRHVPWRWMRTDDAAEGTILTALGRTFAQVGSDR